jgi:hypothetical protein
VVYQVNLGRGELRGLLLFCLFVFGDSETKIAGMLAIEGIRDSELNTFGF